jgi:Family of unknown function (DUF5681)
MSDDSVGRDRVGPEGPAAYAQRKKGRNRNLRRRQRPAFEGALATLDRLLVTLVPISLNGETKKVEALDAIVTQLLAKAISGNARAYRTLLKYQEFASANSAKKLQLIFVESGYTRAVAEARGGDDV